jgi:hypothetical protein
MSAPRAEICVEPFDHSSGTDAHGPVLIFWFEARPRRFPPAQRWRRRQRVARYPAVQPVMALSILDAVRTANGSAMPQSWPVPRRFALRISALFSFPSQIDRPVCPPGCIGLLTQLTPSPAGKYSERHPARPALADARPLELTPSARQTARGIASAQSPEADPVAGTFQRACPHLEDVEMIKTIGVRRNAVRIPPAHERRAGRPLQSSNDLERMPVNSPCQPYEPGSSSPNSECTYWEP